LKIGNTGAIYLKENGKKHPENVKLALFRRKTVSVNYNHAFIG
jgi:hypothetical protein